MKVSIFASILCFFAITVLAAPPPPKKMCKTQLGTPDGPIVIDSVSGECQTLPAPTYPFSLKLIQPISGMITAFSTSKCDSKPVFNQQSPVQLTRRTYVASFIARC